MSKINRVVGRAAFGAMALAIACEPMIIELEHPPAAGAPGSAADSGENLAGAGDAPSDGGGDGGVSQGSAGRGSGGAGAPPLGAGGNASGGSAAAAGEGNGAACGDAVLTDVRNGHDLLPGYTEPPSPEVAQWISAMSLEQQIAQMQGVPVESRDYNDISRSQDVEVGGTVLRGFRYRNGSRGVNLQSGQDNRARDADNFSTSFPTQSIRGASWNPELEWRIGEAIGDETMASLNNVLIGPSVNILRHPYWGRAQEAYGEDAYHVGRMASAFIAGVQQHVAACARNFLAYTIEMNRANQDALADEQTVREIYGRPFQMAVQDGGVACVMTAYGKVNGVNSTLNAHLLRDVLKAPVAQGGFGFRGFVLSDWWAAPGDQGPIDDVIGVAQAAQMANSGLDIEMPWTLNYSSLQAALTAGGVTPAVVTEAASRVLEQKARFGTALATDAWGLGQSTSTLSVGSIGTNEAHLTLAEEAALESAVLLHNGSAGSPVLPIPSGVSSVAIIGADLPVDINAQTTPAKMGGTVFHMVTDVALGDRGSDLVNADPAQSIGPFTGIAQVAYDHGVVGLTSGTSAPEAESSEFVVVMVGFTPGDEGEEYTIPSGGDRASLDLPGSQAQLVNDVLMLDKPTVIVVQSGSIVNTPWLTHPNQKQATVWAGYGGMRGGAALGKLLFGDANFGGKLPIVWPAQNSLPAFKDQPNATSMSYFVGYRYYDRRAVSGGEPELVFPFGHGLSYTTFAYSNPVVPCAEVSSSAVLEVTVDVTNTGAVRGDEVAFLFVAGPESSGTGQRSVKELKSFERVSLSPGETRTVRLPVRIQDLRHWEGGESGRWVVDAGTYSLLVGPSAASEDLVLAGTFTVAD